jgi:hypothetical protein
MRTKLSETQIDPSKDYRITLNAPARHGGSRLRPRDDVIVLGSTVDMIEPQSAIEWVEEVSLRWLDKASL